MRRLFIFLIVCSILNVASPMPAKADGLRLTYQVSIDDPSTGVVRVVACVRSIGQTSPAFTLQYPGGDVNDYVLDYEFRDSTGASLPVDIRTEGGPYPRLYWDVQITHQSSITITYDLLKRTPGFSGHGYHDYLGSEWGTFDHSTLFVEPRHEGTLAAIDQINVSYQLPDGWTAVTPWSFDGQRYWPASWWALYANVSAVGPIDMTKLSVEGELEARLGIQQDLIKGLHKAEYLGDMEALLSYYHAELGLDNAIVASTLIHPIPSFDPDGGESAILLNTLDKRFRAMATYSLWSSWERGSGVAYLWAFETFPPFYGAYVPYELGWVSEARFFRQLGEAYATYRADRASGLDAPLLENPRQIEKGLLVVYMLDQEVQMVTAGAADINDVHRHLVEHVTSNLGWSWNQQTLEEALLAVTGEDFEPFFSDYVDGTAEITLPELADDDGDGVVNHVESIFATDTNKPDTDSDGLSDGDEVYAAQSDPTLADTDGDGIDDGEDERPRDRDDDGLDDEKEGLLGTHPNDPDSDGDGVLDGDEDTDRDGIRDSLDSRPFDALNGDSDGDGVRGTVETNLGLDPTVSDSEGDGLADGEEIYTYLTNPLVSDTDGDGLADHPDPEPTSRDNDGIPDSEEASFGTDADQRDTDDDGLDDDVELGMVVDGYPGDWEGVPPFTVSHYERGVLLEPFFGEIASLRGVIANGDAYLLLTTEDYATTLDPYRYMFYLQANDGSTHRDYLLTVQSGLITFGAFPDPWIVRSDLAVDMRGRFAEFSIPLEEFGNPDSLKITNAIYRNVAFYRDPAFGDGYDINRVSYEGVSDGNAFRRIDVITTDPLNPDTDGDGASDGVETRFGSDPNDPADVRWPVWLPMVLRRP